MPEGTVTQTRYDSLRELTPDAFAARYDPTFIRHRMAQDVGYHIAKAVAAGGGYILVEAPPRHGKSMLISHKTPPWFLSLDPTKNVAVVTYESDFSASWGRRIRDDIVTYGSPLGLTLRTDTRAVSDFKLTAGGAVFCTGIGGPLTGRGFHLLLIDDPIKNSEEAASLTVREKHWDWWQSTASTRLEPGAVVVLMMTRWNEDDLAGRLLQAAKDDPASPQWLHLRYPALCESPTDQLGRKEGEALWPERYNEDTLDQIRRRSGAYYWAAMYQQRPAPLEGGLFESRWFRIVDAPGQAHMPRVRAWDFSARQGRGSDHTAGVLWARSETSPEHVRIEDVNRFQGRPGDVKEEVLATAHEDGPSVIVQIQQDPGQAGAAQIEAYQRLLRGFIVEVYRPTGDKEHRARPFSAKAQGGFVEMVRAPWNMAFIEEACVFPNGKHDDQIDAASAGLQLIETMAPRNVHSFSPDKESVRRREETARLIEQSTPRIQRGRGNYRRVFSEW